MRQPRATASCSMDAGSSEHAVSSRQQQVVTGVGRRCLACSQRAAYARTLAKRDTVLKLASVLPMEVI